MVQTGPAGALPQEYVSALNGAAGGNGSETRQSTYDQNGRLLHQKVTKSDGASKYEVNYSQYDNAGNVISYSMANQDGDWYTNNYTYTMARFDGYKEARVDGSSDKFNPGSTTSSYDVNGNLISVTDSTKAENNRTFVNDAQGHVLYVNQGGHAQRQLVVDGEVLGRYGDMINPNAPQDPNTGNPNFINKADFSFGFQPINGKYPTGAPGAVAVQAAEGAAAATASFGGVMSAGASAMLGGTAVGGLTVTGATLGGISAAVGAAAIGGVAGSLAGQLAGMAMGAQNGISFDQLALSGLSAGIGAGVGAQIAGASIGASALRAAVTNVALQGVGVATGLQSSFNWTSVAASAAGGAVGGVLNAGGANSISQSINKEIGGLLGRTVSGVLVGTADAATTSILRGGRIAIQQVATDAFGNALGQSLTESNDSSQRSAQAVEQQRRDELYSLAGPESSGFGVKVGGNPNTRVETAGGKAYTIIPDGLERSGNSFIVHDAKFS